MRRLLAVFLALAFLLPLLAAPVAAQEVRLFPETGKQVGGEFLTFFDRHGGQKAFGLPVTNEMIEGGRVVQYFTRARLEAWPENPAPYRVQLGLLGVQMGKIEPAIFADVAPSDPIRRFFPETGHVVAFGFKEYWEKNGGLEMFGYPTTEQLVEGGAIVQYFQRVRMEWRPENEAGNQILLGDLGLEYVLQAGWPVQGVAPRTPPPAPAAPPDPGRILFHLQPGGDIYSVRPDGTDLQHIVAGAMDPTASPDGTRITYAAWYPPAIYVRDRATGTTYPLEVTSYPWNITRPQAPQWSADGRYVAFFDKYRDFRPGRTVVNPLTGAVTVLQELKDLWRVDVLNVETGQVHTIVKDDWGVQPAWAPDGRLVFTGIDGLYIVTDLEGRREITKIPNTDSRYRSASWSPDGQWLVFQFRKHDHQDIGLIRPDGSGFHLLTSSPLFEEPDDYITPAWSPDGKQIVFVTNQNVRWEIFVMNADGSDQHRVLDLGDMELDFQNVYERIVSWSR